MISSTTAGGIPMSGANFTSRSRWPPLASVITGEALSTQISLTFYFFRYLFQAILKYRNLESAQSVDEFTAG